MENSRVHPDLFTPDEAAAYLHVDTATLETLRRKNLLTGYSGITRGYVYHRQDLDECALRMTGRGNQIRQKQGLKLAHE